MLSARRVTRGLLFAGSLLTVAGATLTWIVVRPPGKTIVVSGVDAFNRVDPALNGVVTALLAAVAVLLALDDRPSGLAVAAVTGLVVASVAAAYLLAPAAVFGGETGRLTATVTTSREGLYVTLAGGTLTLVGAAATAARARQES